MYLTGWLEQTIKYGSNFNAHLIGSCIRISELGYFTCSLMSGFYDGAVTFNKQILIKD